MDLFWLGLGEHVVSKVAAQSQSMDSPEEQAEAKIMAHDLRA